jgi:hypothetical protein
VVATGGGALEQRCAHLRAPRVLAADEERRGHRDDLGQLLEGVGGERGARIARIAAALAEPVRVRILDVLHRGPGEVCQCELVPLFDIRSRRYRTTSRGLPTPGS